MAAFYRAASWLLLFGDIEESSTGPATLVTGLVSAQILVFVAQVTNDSFSRLPRLA
jgi:hypothetical protein